MTKEELEKVVQGAEYDFLRENPHLGSNIMFLTLGGSHAYGTNVPGSDVDVRGVTEDSKYDLLGFGTFEQVVEQSTDTTIYGFRKLVSLLISCNPNVIEMLGSKPDNYLMVSPEGQMLLDNKALFLSKKALYSFGGYANDQLRRLQMGVLQNDVNTDMKEEFALRSVQRVLSGPDLQHNAPAEAENHFNISIGNVKDEEIKRQLVVNELTMRKKLCNYFVDARWFGMVNTSYSSYNTLGKIEGAFQLSFPMSYDPIRIASISNTRCCVSSDDERKGNEKVPKNKDRTMGRFSVVEYGLYHMYIQTSTKAILRNGVTEDDLKLLIQTILHMFDDDMSSVRPSMTVRKVVVVRQNRNSGRVRPTDIEDAMVAKLKPGINNPTSFNDYDLEFKRDMLPDSVEVKEYTMDNPEGVIL